ncbi:MAG: hypothetical protein E1N59_650 [Puniceicoccaceae bacterium 5H]|nr:MAG: hypothetical protein E1N59_650 [Puniceicoccaceae bacterium 5H]
MPTTAKPPRKANSSSARSDKRYQRRGEMRHSWSALISVFLILIAGSCYQVLKSEDRLAAPGIAFAVSLAGVLLARRGKRKIHRSHGLIQGESHAKIGFWVNLAIALLTFVLFSIRLVNGIVNGNLLF